MITLKENMTLQDNSLEDNTESGISMSVSSSSADKLSDSLSPSKKNETVMSYLNQ